MFVPAGGGSGSYGGDTSSSSSSYSISGMSSNYSQYIKSNGRDGYKLDINLDEKVDEMLKLLEEEGNKDVDHYIKSSNKRDVLKAMLKAELVTQFPDLRSKDEIEKTEVNEKELKDVKDKIPGIIEKLEMISSRPKENQIEKKEFETEKELDNAIEEILSFVEYTEEEINGNTVYTYTQNNNDYKLEKLSDREYCLYEIIDKELTQKQDEYVFRTLKSVNTQEKIYNIFTSSKISKEVVKDYFYANISNIADNNGYDKDGIIDTYFSYVTEIYNKLTGENNTFKNSLMDLFNSVQMDENELQGVIHIKRKTVNESTGKENTRYISYIPYDEFRKLCSEANNKVLDYFTINSNGGIIVAKYRKFDRTFSQKEFDGSVSEEHTYEITESSPISYLSQIYQHTMPFDLLWALLVYGGDYNFIYDLTNLINNTDITITALDTVTDNTDTKTENITVTKKQVNTAKTSDGNISTEGDETTETYTNIYTEHTIDNSVELKLSYINSWIATYTNNDEESKIEKDDPTTDNSENKTDWEKDGEEEKVGSVKAKDMVQEDSSLLKQYKQLMKKNIKKAAKSYNNKTSTYKTARKIIQNSDKLLDIYIEDITTSVLTVLNSTLEEIFNNSFHIDIINLNEEVQKQIKKESNNNEDVERAINKILIDIYNNADWKVEVESLTRQIHKKTETKTETKTEKTTYTYTTASGQIVEKTDKNSDTDNFVTLLNKNGQAHGRLNSISSWFFEAIEKNKVLCDKLDLMKYLLGIAFGRNYGVEEFDFNIYDPENFSSISGEGGSGGASYSSLKLTQEDLEILYKITYAEWGAGNQEQQEYIVSVILNRVLCKDWPNNVKDVVFQDGQFEPTWSGSYDKATPTETTKAAVKSAIQKGDTTGGAVGFMTDWCFEDNLDWINEENGWKELFRDTDKTGSTVVFFTKISAQKELEKYATNTGGNIIQSAEKIHTYMEQNKYTYCAMDWEYGCDHTGEKHGLNDTFEESKNGYHHTCCATYVSWVLRDAGYINVTYHYVSGLASYLESHNWKKVSASELKAGDVMVKPGEHVQIYAGNGQIYNAGYTGAIQRANPYDGGSTSGYYGLRAPNK